MSTAFEFEAVDDFHNFICEDKSGYATAASNGYIDPENMFLIGKSGGFLMNIDFTFVNTHLFQEAAAKYVKYGQYIKDKKGSIAYRKFRHQEEHRRRNGLTAPCRKNKDGSITSLRITGEHYNFLNYVEILRLEQSTAGANNTGKKEKGFPRLFDSQFWWYKCKEFSRANGYNLLVCKTRRAGFSYMEGKGAANSINLKPNKNVLLVAQDKRYITDSGGIADFARQQIDFYETKTPFRRGILSRDIENLRLGIKDQQKRDSGYLSGILVASTFNNSNAAVGKDSDEIKVEERGTFKDFDDFMTQTEPTLRTGSYVTGQAIVFGTVNSSSETADEFERDFRNPEKWRFMPFENVWDRNKRDEVCGFYKPFWWGLEGEIDGKQALDKDGNTDYKIAIQVVEREHKHAHDKANSLKDYIDFKGQYGNCPDDSFANSSSNMFSSEGLDLHIKRVKDTKDFDYHRDGIVETYDGPNDKKLVKFVSNDKLLADGRTREIHPYITEAAPDPKGDNYGCIRMFKPPINLGGGVPNDLYRIWVDPFGVDKKKDEITRDNSFASVIIFKRASTLDNTSYGIPVAVYVGRPEKQETLAKLVLALATLYNAKVLSENDRGDINVNFKHWRRTDLLVREPKFAWDTTLKGATGREWGVSMGAGNNRKLRALELLYEYLYTVIEVDEDGEPSKYVYHTIHDLGILNEIKKYTLGGNFDRVSALLVGMFDLKELAFLNTAATKNGHEQQRANSKSVLARPWY